ncbi:ATP synthase I chain [Granulibacter bethesdensis]|uniref:ATP synthase I chain n=2 Tax=Granulibacter bethesdensis TaxID=364410 RepID=A0AAC9KD35_9PROT|nr:ATP synthase I chain [Granulibacter bethesdensis]APH62770.1 ATP synthase I chain [Granulibacter bethesdensis]
MSRMDMKENRQLQPQPGQETSTRVSSQGFSFQQRLNAARNRQGLGTDGQNPTSVLQAPDGSPGPSAMGIGLRIGADLVSALIVGVAIGYGLDRWLGTMPLFLILFILMGGAAGILNVWRTLRRMPAGQGQSEADDATHGRR